jgi:PAS domain S-box-containing protein
VLWRARLHPSLEKRNLAVDWNEALHLKSPPIDENRQVGGPWGQPYWQALLDSASDGVWGMDRAGNCTFVNRAATEMLGFTQEEMLGRDMHVLVHHHRGDGSDCPVAECPGHRVLNGSQPLCLIEDTIFRKDGSAFPAKTSAEPISIDGTVVAVVVRFRDASEQVKVGQALRVVQKLSEQREAEIDALIESVPHGVFIARRDGSVQMNGRGRAMTGESFPPELLTLARALRGESSTETRCLPELSLDPALKASSKRWIRSVAVPVVSNGQIWGGVAVNTDVTLDRLQEDVLRRAEKLAAAGQLASSIAHEINDPLESITNLLYLLRHSSGMDEVQEYAKLAQSELSRVVEITQQTLKFHRAQSRPAAVELADLIETILMLYSGRFLVRGIALKKRLLNTPPVFCHEGEIRQVLNNLARNAIDAMSGGGKLTVRLGPACDQRGVRGVRITIADGGEGISPEIAAHLFEPFRTTKELTGTGLGLWVTKGIVDKHGGRISVRTRRTAPTGTVFSIWLPEDASAFFSTTAMA